MHRLAGFIQRRYFLYTLLVILVALKSEYLISIFDFDRNFSKAGKTDSLNCGSADAEACNTSIVKGNPPVTNTRHHALLLSGRGGLLKELNVTDIYELAHRADKGDPKSTCVISALIRSCSSISDEFWPDYWLEQAAESEPKSDEELKAVESILHLESLAERKLQLCKNLRKSQLDQSGRRKLQAARAHVPGAAAEFFSRPKLVNSKGEVDTKLAKLYQYEAPFLLETAAMQGDPDALFWLFHLLTNGHFTVRGGVEIRINVDMGKAWVVGQRLLLVADEDTVESVKAELSKLTTSLTEADIKHAAAIEKKFITPTQQTNFHGLPEHPLERMDRCNLEYG